MHAGRLVPGARRRPPDANDGDVQKQVTAWWEDDRASRRPEVLDWWTTRLFVETSSSTTTAVSSNTELRSLLDRRPTTQRPPASCLTVFSQRDLTFTFAICCCPSVCRLSVTLVHPTQAVVNFGNFSTAFGTLAIRWHAQKILWISSQGNSSARGVKPKRDSKI